MNKNPHVLFDPFDSEYQRADGYNKSKAENDKERREGDQRLCEASYYRK